MKLNVTEIFEVYRDQGLSDEAAAMLTLADVVNDNFSSLSHEIAIGVRMGMFGKNAKDDVSAVTEDTAERIADDMPRGES